MTDQVAEQLAITLEMLEITHDELQRAHAENKRLRSNIAILATLLPLPTTQMPGGVPIYSPKRRVPA